LIHDAQYTAEELPQRIDFGHSAAEYAVELGRRSGAARVLLFHHDPARTDDEVAAIERDLRTADQTDVDAAREGMVIQLSSRTLANVKRLAEGEES
jgi:ribonuclease BN (tRNA processing enzyme)